MAFGVALRVAAAPTPASITPLAGVPTNPFIFGLNDVIGPIVNLTYSDAAVLHARLI